MVILSDSKYLPVSNVFEDCDSLHVRSTAISKGKSAMIVGNVTGYKTIFSIKFSYDIRVQYINYNQF